VSRRKKMVGLAVIIAVLLVLLTATTAWGAGVDPSIDSTAKIVNAKNTAIGLDLLWIVIGAVLVIFMQAGFALVETGFCRAKHAAHVVSTNFAIFGLGFVGFFLVGYSIMFSGYSSPGIFGYDKALSSSSLIHVSGWVFLWGKSGFGLSGLAYSVPVMAFFLYMVAFMDTTATIPTGAMAERWKWKAFVGWGIFCGAIYYPLFGAWTWGGGWLSQLGNSMHFGFGYVDFAGSGVVHAMGGVAALAGAIVLGPRIGKFNRDGSANTLSAHHIPMAMLGCFILLFGWFGFNAASTLAATDIQFAIVAVNTALAAAFGATAAMFFCMYTKPFKKPDPGMMVNGMLAGLVAITAPCAFVDPYIAAIIGTIAGVLVVVSCGFFERRGIDDPVGAISVHGVCGIWGVLCIGLFANGQYGGGWNLTSEGPAANAKGVTGLFYDASLGSRQLVAQAIGALVLCTVMFGVAFLFFKLQNAFMKGGIRPEADIEMIGLDMPEMGALAYPDFMEQDAVTMHAGTSPTHEVSAPV